jgi:Protein of unknown function (DUF2933)
MAYLVSLLPFLACPLVMGLMFWMIRGNKDQSAEQTHQTHLTTANESTKAPQASVMSGLHICLNWKVVAGLAVVGLGIWVVAPGLAWAALPILVVLACPLSMLFMLRGMGGGQCAVQPAQEQQMARAGVSDERLAELRAQQAAIVREIAELEGASPTTGPTIELGPRVNGAHIYERS